MQITQRSVFWGIALYCLGHALLRLTLTPTLGWDDAESTLWAQRLAPGYTTEQPPLYVWLLWLGYRIGGPDIWVSTVVRYGLMFGTYALLYDAARRVCARTRGALLALCGYGMVYTLAFYQHHDLTNTTSMMFGLAWAFAAWIRLNERPRAVAYAELGAALAVGLLSKYNFVLFIAGAAVAALRDADMRRVLRDRRAWLTLCVAAMPVSVNIVWLLTTEATVWGVGAEALETPVAMSWGRAVLVTLPRALLRGAELMLPFLVIAPLVFPALLRAGKRDASRWQRFLQRQVLYTLVLTTIVLVLLAAGTVKPRWFLPALGLLPVLLFAGDVDWAQMRVRQRVYVGLFLAICMVVPVVRVIADRYEPLRSDKTRWTLPVQELAAIIRARGYGNDTIIAERSHLAGNLALHVPTRHVISLGLKRRHTLLDPARPRLYVWKVSREHKPGRMLRGMRWFEGERVPLEPDELVDVPYARCRSRAARFALKRCGVSE